jgi:hypothetical protein
MRRRSALGGLAAAALAGAAHAADGWTPCRIQDGALVVSAKAAGLSGDFVLDTGTAQTAIDATQASLAGIETDHVRAPLRLAGRRYSGLDMAVAALDARTRNQPTPITGVLGADVLAGLTLEVIPDPCRLRLTARAAPIRALAVLPVELGADGPTIMASVTDGGRSARGRFRVSTGADVGVRLEPRLARADGLLAEHEVATLRGLSMDDVLIEEPSAAIADQDEAGLAGEIGEPVWSAYGFQLDLRRGRLALFDPQQQKARRRRSGGP